MKVTDETKRVAQSIVDYIIENPGMHNQDAWWDGKDGRHPTYATNICQTTMCIAGTAVYLESGVEGLKNRIDHVNGEGFHYAGQRILGLNDEEANALFYSGNAEAFDATKAIAEGDVQKFNEILDVEYYEGFDDD